MSQSVSQAAGRSVAGATRAATASLEGQPAAKSARVDKEAEKDLVKHALQTQHGVAVAITNNKESIWGALEAKPSKKGKGKAAPRPAQFSHLVLLCALLEQERERVASWRRNAAAQWTGVTFGFRREVGGAGVGEEGGGG